MPQFNMRIPALIKAAAELQSGFDHEFATDMVKRFGLVSKKKYQQLSYGMKAMVTTIIALASTAPVILLDEPTLGFDPVARSQFNVLLQESLEAHPRTIIISTHLIDEIAKVAQHLIIIDNGRLVLQAGIGDIDEKAYTLSGSAKAVEPLLADLNCIGRTVAGSVMAAHIYDRRIKPPTGVSMDNLSLEDFFVTIVTKGADHV